MGCCSSKTQLKAVSGSVPGAGNGTTLGGGQRSVVRQPTTSEKRERAAAAAETRAADWRQGGAVDPEKAKSMQDRRTKDELLARIFNRYAVLGKEPPIGLPSCDIDQLRRHLETLR